MTQQITKMLLHQAAQIVHHLRTKVTLESGSEDLPCRHSFQAHSPSGQPKTSQVLKSNNITIKYI